TVVAGYLPPLTHRRLAADGPICCRFDAGCRLDWRIEELPASAPKPGDPGGAPGDCRGGFKKHSHQLIAALKRHSSGGVMNLWSDEQILVHIEGPDSERDVVVPGPVARIGAHPDSQIVLEGPG